MIGRQIAGSVRSGAAVVVVVATGGAVVVVVVVATGDVVVVVAGRVVVVVCTGRVVVVALTVVVVVGGVVDVVGNAGLVGAVVTVVEPVGCAADGGAAGDEGEVGLVGDVVADDGGGAVGDDVFVVPVVFVPVGIVVDAATGGVDGASPLATGGATTGESTIGASEMVIGAVSEAGVELGEVTPAGRADGSTATADVAVGVPSVDGSGAEIGTRGISRDVPPASKATGEL